MGPLKFNPNPIKATVYVSPALNTGTTLRYVVHKPSVLPGNLMITVLVIFWGNLTLLKFSLISGPNGQSQVRGNWWLVAFLRVCCLKSVKPLIPSLFPHSHIERTLLAPSSNSQVFTYLLSLSSLRQLLLGVTRSNLHEYIFYFLMLSINVTWLGRLSRTKDLQKSKNTGLYGDDINCILLLTRTKPSFMLMYVF